MPASGAQVPAASPSIPATSEHEHSAPEPYWPRLARALMLLFLAVSLHVWGVRSPDPQEPVYAMLASRLVDSVLVSPPLPLAPPLRPIMSQRWSGGRRVTIQTSVLNVPPVPGPPVSSHAVDPRLVAVGTSGTRIGWATETPDVAPSLAPAAPPARTTLDDSPIPAAAESRPAPMNAAFTTIPLREPRIQATAPSLDGLASSASRVVLPADRKEADPSDPAAEQGRVLAVVREYTRALERLDVLATKAVYPSVDDRRLRRDFEGVETQRFQLGSCDVSFSSSGHGANAWCLGNSTYRPKIGSRVLRYTDRVWEFNLARDGGGWQILEARVQ
jgi:hypothetical protein